MFCYIGYLNIFHKFSFNEVFENVVACDFDGNYSPQVLQLGQRQGMLAYACLVNTKEYHK